MTATSRTRGRRSIIDADDRRAARPGRKLIRIPRPWVPSHVDMCSERTQEIERQNRQGATSDCLVARERTTGVASSEFCSVGSTESWAMSLTASGFRNCPT